MKRKMLFFSILSLSCAGSFAQETCTLPDPFDRGIAYLREIHVAPNGSDSAGLGTNEKPYATLGRAARNAPPGTKIVLQPGNHIPNQYIDNLQGTAEAPVLITGLSAAEPAVFSGGGEAVHLTDPRYVVLQNLRAEGCTGNGINIDDGGSFNTPAEHLILRGVEVRNIGPTGNRDGIKLSGVARFRIEESTIDRPGDGGSGIDMVGCHEGVIAHNRFLNIKDSGVQAKGGTDHILIYANRFQGGGRALNLGGSTGLSFFRPIDAPYEGAYLTALANVFTDCDTPVAFVGSENCLFANNVVYKPSRWAARILQETRGERFVPSRNNVYANNIVVIDDRVQVLVNVGPDTAPDTFRFLNNLWFHAERNNWRLSGLPGANQNSIVQKDPLFRDPEGGNFDVQDNSPAVGTGIELSTLRQTLPVDVPETGDRQGRCWTTPPDIGAYSRNPVTLNREWKKE